jgi:hypothetical protein
LSTGIVGPLFFDGTVTSNSWTYTGYVNASPGELWTWHYKKDIFSSKTELGHNVNVVLDYLNTNFGDWVNSNWYPSHFRYVCGAGLPTSYNLNPCDYLYADIWKNSSMQTTPFTIELVNAITDARQSTTVTRSRKFCKLPPDGHTKRKCVY